MGIATTVAAGALAVALAGTALASQNTNDPVLKAQVNGTAQVESRKVPHAFIELDTWPDSMAGSHGTDGGPHPDWVTYGPSTNLELPANSLITVTIKQYDGGEQITNPYFAKVHGTVDGTISVDGQSVTGVDPAQVGHTFTLHSLIQNQDQLFVSIPLPAVADDAPILANGYPAPHLITFSFMTKGAGTYVFNCEFPCGDGTYAKFGGPMSTQGYMAGTVKVTA
ncbi:MAG: hypothetical protein ACOH2F_01445 [Cellulomonas sp.]